MRRRRPRPLWTLPSSRILCILFFPRSSNSKRGGRHAENLGTEQIKMRISSIKVQQAQNRECNTSAFLYVRRTSERPQTTFHSLPHLAWPLVPLPTHPPCNTSGLKLQYVLLPGAVSPSSWSLPLFAVPTQWGERVQLGRTERSVSFFYRGDVREEEKLHEPQVEDTTQLLPPSFSF